MTGKSTEKHNIKIEYILEVVNYIRENFHLDLNMNTLVKLVPLSSRNLEVKFKDEMSISIYLFIINLRIENTAFLLIDTDFSILDIILNLGSMITLTCTEYSKGLKDVL